MNGFRVGSQVSLMSDADSAPAGGGETEATTTYEADERTLDRAFELLGGQQRRYVLEKLRASSDGSASVDALADHLLAHAPEATDRERVKIALYHRTLPKLDDDNVVDFDPRTATARYHEAELIEDLLDFVAA